MKTKVSLITASFWTLSVLCFILISPKWVFAPAAWVAPAFLLAFMQRVKPLKSVLLAFLSLLLSSLVANYHVIPFPGIVFLIATCISCLIGMVPYTLHRLLYKRIHSWLAVFVFPCSFVLLEYLSAQGNGRGTWGLLAYSQVDNLPLLQVASITGVWGISFLLYWFNSTLAWISDPSPTWVLVRTPMMAVAAAVLVVLLFGTWKSNPYFYTSQETVRMAGITDSNLQMVKSIYEDAFQVETEVDLDALAQQGKLTITSPELQEMQKGLQIFIENPLDKKFERSRIRIEALQDSLFARAAQEARAGARIISFSEALIFIIKSEESKFIGKGRQFAIENHAYLLLTAATVLPGKLEAGKKFIENKSWLIDPQGQVLNTFLKNRPVPFAEAGSTPGDGVVPVVKTSYGNLATSICYDADFPSLIKQAGEKRAGILLLPSGDWREISPYHSQMARVRAVENGFSLFRTVSGAISIACDFHGRIVATRNYYDRGDKTMIAYLPIKGIMTTYTLIGDSFVWLCATCLILLVASAFTKVRQS